MEKIVVSIRVRPLNKQEASKGSPWRIASNAISLCNQNTGAVLPGQSYVFDSVFGTEDKTQDIYDTHTKAIISSAVRGINGTVFAYGQTSSGKTFTMRGSSTEPGIIPLSVRDVFHNIQQADDREFLLRVSYMEIYNEEINDLLAPENRKLQIHENLERGIFVAGLREEIVSSPEQVLQLLEFGEAHRHIGETNMNVYSSRSHTIFRMVIESRDRSQDDPNQPSNLQACDAVRVSVLNLVDLAGSERVAKTGAEGARLKEGSHINKSLMTLGTVINKLSEGIESQGGHVPYRDSKLTRILQPALGGNARTVIICNVTPALVHVDETKGTLQFASRAIRVTNCAQVNEIVTDAALLKRQKREIEELRNKLQESHSEHLEEEILNLRNAMLKIELERERMALELQNKSERERRMKEQIENLSTMVLNSAVDDRHTDKSVKKSNRRETWCPRLTSSEPIAEVQKASLFATKRERALPLPPPFESLKEEEDVPMHEAKEEAAAQGIENSAEPPVLNYVADRRHKLSSRLRANEEELLDLQARYQALHCDYEVAISEIEKLRSENERLKVTDIKSSTKPSEGDRRRCKSVDGNEADISTGIVSELQSQVQNLEMEKYYMQRELDSRIQHGKSQANSAKQVLEGLYEELKESNRQIDSLTARNVQLEEDKEEMSRSYLQLATVLDELNCEVNKTLAYSASCLDNLMDEARSIRVPSQCFENIKAMLEEKLAIEEARMGELQKSVVEITKLSEQTFEDESSKLKSEILALQKELLSAKSAPSALQKDKEGMRKELEKIKNKLKDVEAKLRTTLQDKSKLEAEKANLEKELKTLRGQSTLLQRDIDRRDSLADKRRDSLACFNKAKHQLNSAEYALQQKSRELEETAFELQILQDAYQEVEGSLREHKQTAEFLQEKLTSAQEELAALKQERDEAVTSANNIAIELEAATEQWGASRSELEKLQEEHNHLSRELEERNVTCQTSEKLIEELSKVKEELSMELIDVHYKLEEEKAVSASRQSLIDEKESQLSATNNKLRAVAEVISQKSASSEALQRTLTAQLSRLEQRAVENEAQLDAAFKDMIEKLGAELDLLKQREECASIDIAVQHDASLQALENKMTSKLSHLEHEAEEREAVFRKKIEEFDIELDSIKQKVAAFEIAVEKTVSIQALDRRLMEQLSRVEHEADEREAQLYSFFNVKMEPLEIELDVIREKVCEVEAAIQNEIQKSLQDSQVQELNQMLEASKIELSNALKLKDRTEELEHANRMIEKKMHELAASLQDTEKTCVLYKETIDQLTEDLKCIRCKCERLEEECAQLKVKEDDQGLQNGLLTERVSQLQAREAELEAMLRAAKTDDEDRDRIRDLLVLNTKLQIALDAMFGRAEVYEGRLEDARWDLIEFKDKAGRTKENLEASLAAAKLEIVELKVELESVKGDGDFSLVEKTRDENREFGHRAQERDAYSTKRKPSELQSQNFICKPKKIKDGDQERKEGRALDDTTPAPCLKVPAENDKSGVRRSPLSPLDNLQTPRHESDRGKPNNGRQAFGK